MIFQNVLPPYSHVGYFGGVYKIRKLVFDKLHNDEHSKHALRAVKAFKRSNYGAGIS